MKIFYFLFSVLFMLPSLSVLFFLLCIIDLFCSLRSIRYICKYILSGIYFLNIGFVFFPLSRDVILQASGAKNSVGDRPHFLYGAHQRPHNGRIDVVPRQSSRCKQLQAPWPLIGQCVVPRFFVLRLLPKLVTAQLSNIDSIFVVVRSINSRYQ